MKKNGTEPNVDEEVEGLEPYQVDKFSKIPAGIILTFAKFWAAAAAVFFILIGGLDLGIDFSKDTADVVEDMAISVRAIILVSLFLAILLNYGIKHLAHLMYSRRNNTKKWMTINLKGFFGFLAYLAYTIVCMIILYLIVSFMSYYKLVPSLLENGGMGIEPFSFGFYYIIIDGIFLLIKNYLVKLFQYLKYKKQIAIA
jgi:hypothetical protein